MSKLIKLKKEMSAIDKELSRLQNRKKELSKEIEILSREPRITDHAVIRYLERVFGFDFDKVREEIMSPIVYQAIEAGATSIKHKNITLQIKDRCVVTILR